MVGASLVSSVTTPTRHVVLPEIVRSVVKALPPGDCLDMVVLSWRPGIDGVTGEVSNHALSILNRERNLYGECIAAATTHNAQALSAAAYSPKARVRRAAALNPRLSEQDSMHLWRTAGVRRDPSLAISLLRRSPHLGVLLSKLPEVLSLLSTRGGFPGPYVLAVRLALLPAQDIRVIGQKVFPDLRLEARMRDSAQEVLASAVSLLLQMVSEDDLVPSAFSFAAVCQYLAPAAVGTRTRYNEFYELRGRFAREIAALPGYLVVHVMNTVGVSTEDSALPVPDQFRLRMASLFSLATALSCTDYQHHSSIASNFEYWCPPGQRETGHYLAGRFTSFEELDTFRSLCREWTGSLDSLVSASRSL